MMLYVELRLREAAISFDMISAIAIPISQRHIIFNYDGSTF